MSTSTPSWPCPICADILPVGHQDCHRCDISALWIDQLCALDFTIRHFHYLSLVGSMSKQEYRSIVEAVIHSRADFIRSAQGNRPIPREAGLPYLLECWHCGGPCELIARGCASCGAATDMPEVRLWRYQTFLGREIQRHEQAGRLSANSGRKLLAETAASVDNLRQNLTATIRGT